MVIYTICFIYFFVGGGGTVIGYFLQESDICIKLGFLLNFVGKVIILILGKGLSWIFGTESVTERNEWLKVGQITPNEKI